MVNLKKIIQNGSDLGENERNKRVKIYSEAFFFYNGTKFEIALRMTHSLPFIVFELVA